MRQACDGLRVIDFSTWMAGPLATMVLADYGADVIKVEPPDGDPARQMPAFQTWNRGKRGIVLDLKTERGRASALELASASDVVVTSFRPGVADRLGIGYEALREVNPRGVYAAISGYGETGTRRSLKGYDALVTAKSGRMMMFERVADRPGPAFPAMPCASYSAAMLTVQGILAALYMRRKTGLGQKVGVSLLSALMPFDMIMWIGWQLRGGEIEAAGQPAPMVLQKLLGERTLPGSEARRGGSYDPAQLHRPGVRVPRPNYLIAVTKDGVWLQFANTIDHLCLAQMQALDLVDLYGEERFAKLPAVFTEDDADELWGIVLERVRSKTYDEWADVFAGYDDLAVERVRWPTESLDHRQVVHNGDAIEVRGAAGQRIVQPGPIVGFAGEKPAIVRRAPNLGEHTDEVLAEVPRVRTSAKAAPSMDVKSADREAPLDGVTVVDFSTWIAAPYSTAMIAALGARVIKVEQVGGDMSRYSTGGLLSFPMTQGKESIALDLKDERGREIAHRLIARADVVVHNYRAGVVQRLGIDYESCRRLNPQIIYLNEASYGDSGPDCRRPAFFATAAAIGGNTLRQAGAGRPIPDAQSLPLDDLKVEAWRLLKGAEGNADPIASLGGATALLLGLHARGETGAGCSLLTTMICSNMWANSDEVIRYEGRPESLRVDDKLMGLGPAHRLYQGSDGWVFVACARRSEWDAFCEMIARPDLGRSWECAWEADLQSAGARDPAYAIGNAIRQRSAAEWEQMAATHDVPLVAVEERDPGRFNLQDDDMRAMGYAVEVESPVHGSYWRHGVVQHFTGAGQTLGGWEPLGGHTRAILDELGYGAEHIGWLIDEGVVEAWTPEAG